MVFSITKYYKKFFTKDFYRLRTTKYTFNETPHREEVDTIITENRY